MESSNEALRTLFRLSLTTKTRSLFTESGYEGGVAMQSSPQNVPHVSVIRADVLCHATPPIQPRMRLEIRTSPARPAHHKQYAATPGIHCGSPLFGN